MKSAGEPGDRLLALVRRETDEDEPEESPDSSRVELTRASTRATRLVTPGGCASE